MDDARIDEFYSEIKMLHHLEKKNRGELPGESVALLTVLAASWLCIGGWFLFSAIRNKNLKKTQK